MTTEEEFWKAMEKNPNDRSLQLVFADWLEENANSDVAKSIRYVVSNNIEIERLTGRIVGGYKLKNKIKGSFFTFKYSDCIPDFELAFDARFGKFYLIDWLFKTLASLI